MIQRGTAISPTTAPKFVESPSSFGEWQATRSLNAIKMNARITTLPARERNAKTAAARYPKYNFDLVVPLFELDINTSFSFIKIFFFSVDSVLLWLMSIIFVRPPSVFMLI